MKSCVTTRRGFLTAAAASALAASGNAGAVFAGRSADFDDNLSVFLADIHVPKEQWWSRPIFETVVADILRMRPLPRRVVIFGDLALYWGSKSDYEGSFPYLKHLTDAGIELTIGMGNHDRRSAFLEVWPEYAGRTLVPGRIVTETRLAGMDLLMLDGLQGTDDRGARDCGPSRGLLDEAQQEWLVAELARRTRPVLVASHYPIEDLKVAGKPLGKLLLDSPNAVGYVHGHTHTASSHWIGDKRRFLRTMCLPSASMDTDLGYVLFRTGGDEAQAKLVMKDFLYPILGKGDRRPAGWNEIVKDKNGRVCTFRIPKA